MARITIPNWVTDLVRKHGSDDPYTRFIMTKCLDGSDMDIQRQNGLLIPSQYVDANLIPMLSGDEKAAAGLPHVPTSTSKMPSTSRVQRSKHRGLKVCVYAQGEFRCHLMLARWDSESTVIKGPDYKCLLNRCFLQENDMVEMWGFRKGKEGKLCFTLGKKEW